MKWCSSAFGYEICDVWVLLVIKYKNIWKLCLIAGIWQNQNVSAIFWFCLPSTTLGKYALWAYAECDTRQSACPGCCQSHLGTLFAECAWTTLGKRWLQPAHLRPGNTLCRAQSRALGKHPLGKYPSTGGAGHSALRSTRHPALPSARRHSVKIWHRGTAEVQPTLGIYKHSAQTLPCERMHSANSWRRGTAQMHLTLGIDKNSAKWCAPLDRWCHAPCSGSSVLPSVGRQNSVKSWRPFEKGRTWTAFLCRVSPVNTRQKVCQHDRERTLGKVLFTGRIVAEYYLPSAELGTHITDMILSFAVCSGHSAKTLFPVVSGRWNAGRFESN